MEDDPKMFLTVFFVVSVRRKMTMNFTKKMTEKTFFFRYSRQIFRLTILSSIMQSETGHLKKVPFESPVQEAHYNPYLSLLLSSDLQWL